MIVGIVGKKRNGKDTLADVLVKDYRYQKFSFASHLKALDDSILILMEDGKFDVENVQEAYESIFKRYAVNTEQVAKEIIDLYHEPRSLELAPDGKRRYALQRLGTEVLRSKHELIHCHSLFYNEEPYAIPYTAKNIVLTDVRFINEEGAIREYGKHRGLPTAIIRVVRLKDGAPIDNTEFLDQGLEASVQSHKSEIEMDAIREDALLINIDDHPMWVRKQLHTFMQYMERLHGASV